MGSHLGYIGNEPVYDNRMRGLPARTVGVTDLTQPGGPHHYEREKPSGEDRFQRKLKSLKLADAEPCELLVPHKGEHSRRMSWLLMDGVKAGAALIAFDLRGNGIHLLDQDNYLIRMWGGLQVFDPKDLRQHHCHARGCAASVPPKLFMCRKHWGMVPKELQDLVWKHYQPGQELGRATPTAEYLDVTDSAIHAVETREALEAQAKAEREAEYQARKLEKENARRKRKGGNATKTLL